MLRQFGANKSREQNQIQGELTIPIASPKQQRNYFSITFCFTLSIRLKFCCQENSLFLCFLNFFKTTQLKVMS